jgi:hypothetical protein
VTKPCTFILKLQRLDGIVRIVFVVHVFVIGHGRVLQRNQRNYPMDRLPAALLIPASALKFGEKIGEGAFGVVYKGKLKGTAVAIKVGSRHVTENSQQRLGGFLATHCAFFRRITSWLAHVMAVFHESPQSMLVRCPISSRKPPCCQLCTTTRF